MGNGRGIPQVGGDDPLPGRAKPPRMRPVMTGSAVHPAAEIERRLHWRWLGLVAFLAIADPSRCLAFCARRATTGNSECTPVSLGGTQ